MVCIVILSANGERRVMKTSLITGVPTGTMVSKAVRKTRPAEDISRANGLILWGWRDGKKGTENKHRLTTTSQTLFGDIVLTAETERDISLSDAETVAPTTVEVETLAPVKPAPRNVLRGSDPLQTEGGAGKHVPVKTIDEVDDESGEEEDSDEEEIDDDEDEEDEESESEEDESEKLSDSESESEAEEDGSDNGDCNDEDECGGKRRASRRRPNSTSDFRRVDTGVRSRLMFPQQPTKRAPRWLTEAELEAEKYGAPSTVDDVEIRQRVSNLVASTVGEQLTDEQQVDVERGIYNSAITEAKSLGVRSHWGNAGFTDIYKMIARRVVSNINPTGYVGNTRLLTRIKEGEFPAHQVAFMSSRELFPEHWQALADEQLKRETTMLEGNQGEGCDLFKCRRCGKSRTRYWEMQTRSADEPMTVFIRCLNCGKEWRQ